MSPSTEQLTPRDPTPARHGGMGAGFPRRQPLQGQLDGEDRTRHQTRLRLLRRALLRPYQGSRRLPEMCHRAADRAAAPAPHRRQRGRGAAAKKPVPAPGLEEAEIEVEGVEEEAEEDLIEDAADLEDNADTIVPEIEVEPDSDETER